MDTLQLFRYLGISVSFMLPNWQLGDGYAIAWDDLDEHIGIEGLLAGKSSGESDHSFERWLTARATA